MNNFKQKLAPKKAGFILLSTLVAFFAVIFTAQAHAASISVDLDPAHHSTNAMDMDPAHHVNDPKFTDTDPAHNSTDAMDMDPAHHVDSASPAPTGSTNTPTPTGSTSTPTPTGMDMNMGNGEDTNMAGFTDGWFQGRTVTFFYHNKNFFCKNPPASGATSQCEAGADAQQMPPQNDIPPLYVMTPLGFTPSGLQCPETGNCINHPHTIDLSAVLGKGTENAPLPPHSHIIDAADPGWWKIVVIGVKSQADWDKIAAGKDLATVRGLQQSDPTNVTADIPTNSFLFFDVLSHGNYQFNGSQLTNLGQ
ncbi:MAG: hypothetical protein ACR2LN_01475 [Candidatus Levyibacteriota bacterium]